MGAIIVVDALWGDSQRFPYQADIMRDRLHVLFGTSIRTGEMLAIQRPSA